MSKLKLVWRDENYGHVRNAFAFRAHFDPEISNSKRNTAVKAFLANGFEFDDARASWIARGKPEDMPLWLAEALEDAGFELEHGGAVPDALDDSTPRP